MKIEVVKRSILDLDVDAIVNPANSLGYMGSGLSLEIRNKGGQEIEDDILDKSPMPLGSAIASISGNLPFKCIIHAPTMEQPGGISSIEIVRSATKAALECAEDLGIESLAFPGMGTGIGGLDLDSVAHAMIEVIVNFDAHALNRVVLSAISDKLYRAFEKVLHP